MKIDEQWECWTLCAIKTEGKRRGWEATTPETTDLSRSWKVEARQKKRSTRYSTTTLQHYGTTALQHDSTIALQRGSTIALRHHHTTELQHYNTIALQQQYSMQHHRTTADYSTLPPLLTKSAWSVLPCVLYVLKPCMLYVLGAQVPGTSAVGCV